MAVSSITLESETSVSWSPTTSSNNPQLLTAVGSTAPFSSFSVEPSYLRSRAAARQRRLMKTGECRLFAATHPGERRSTSPRQKTIKASYQERLNDSLKTQSDDEVDSNIAGETVRVKQKTEELTPEEDEVKRRVFDYYKAYYTIISDRVRFLGLIALGLLLPFIYHNLLLYYDHLTQSAETDTKDSAARVVSRAALLSSSVLVSVVCWNLLVEGGRRIAVRMRQWRLQDSQRQPGRPSGYRKLWRRLFGLLSFALRVKMQTAFVLLCFFIAHFGMVVVFHIQLYRKVDNPAVLSAVLDDNDFSISSVAPNLSMSGMEPRNRADGMMPSSIISKWEFCELLQKRSVGSTNIPDCSRPDNVFLMNSYDAWRGLWIARQLSRRIVIEYRKVERALLGGRVTSNKKMAAENPIPVSQPLLH